MKLLECEAIQTREKGNEKYRIYLKKGLKTKGQFTEDNKWYNCTIDEVYEDGSIQVTYDPPYGNTENLTIGKLLNIRKKKEGGEEERGEKEWKK